MKTLLIDVLGKPCPIPVIEAKKALLEGGAEGVLVRVDNFIAVQNLEKMAKGYGCGFSCAEASDGVYEVRIIPSGTINATSPPLHGDKHEKPPPDNGSGGLTVVIGRDTMGEGAEELGKILIKGFIYALSELPATPDYVIFLNSGAKLTAAGANTIEDLVKLGRKGTKVLTCGTCVNYYGLPAPAVGEIADMYGITEKMANAATVVNI